MTTHSSILAWEIPWTEEHSELQQMGSRDWHIFATKPPQSKVISSFVSGMGGRGGGVGDTYLSSFLERINTYSWIVAILSSSLTNIYVSSEQL